MKALLATCLLVTHQAQAFCPQLDELISGSETMVLPQPLGTRTDCTTALGLSGRSSTHCAWAFDYRADTASEVFEAVVQEVPACFDGVETAREDQDVNHPDFYDLRIFNTPLGEVGVSLKDKASLQKTYVFLSVTANN